MSHLSPMLAFDVSIPIGRIGEAVERMRGELEARWPVQDGLYFGHIGDSNLHLIYSLADDGNRPHSKPKPSCIGS